jgi:excisionase family DNA binding protein
VTYQWVSVEEAARRLGISVSTVRRRIEAGELVGEREVIGGSKERYRVKMPHDASQPESSHESPEASPASESTLTVAEGLLALVREMRQQGISDAERIETLHQEVRQQAERAALWQERAVTADARADRAERERAALAEEAARLRAEAAKRRWWKFWEG